MPLMYRFDTGLTERLVKYLEGDLKKKKKLWV